MSILVFNAGSSTLKFGLYTPAGEKQTTGETEWPPNKPLASLPDLNLAKNKKHPDAIGHRVVHGGTRFQESVRIDSAVKEDIASLFELAPLHNPRALKVIEACEKKFPGVPQVAVFDTAFFSGLPPREIVYPLPYKWFIDWKIRRFGFHGISHAYCTGRVTELMRRTSKAGLRLVICHLGRGCSAAAVYAGNAVATTMGFTPLEGLMMGDRSGSVDPGILLYVQRKHGLSAKHLEEVLNGKSGLLGVSGVSSDFREVEKAAKAGNKRAALAFDMFAGRVRGAIGSLSVTLGGLDALVFTGGIGEHSAHLRKIVCQGLDCLGLRLDLKRNKSVKTDIDIAETNSPARIWVIQTQEEERIARETQRIVSTPAASSIGTKRGSRSHTPKR